MGTTDFSWKGLIELLIIVLLAWVIVAAVFLVGLSWVSSAAATGRNEQHYQAQWCNAQGGKMEVRVRGGRVDCVTARFAVEFDFAPKWKECIAQARWYALMTGKHPACALIMGPGDGKYREMLDHYLSMYDVYLKVIEVEK